MTIEVLRKLPEHPLLGRTIIELDSRSRGFAAPLSSMLLRDRSWRRGRPYDQGETSACTGYARKGLANTAPFAGFLDYPKRSRIDAYGLYRRAQRDFDSWPGEEPDYYGTSVLAVMKAAKAMGLTDRDYRWLFGGAEARAWLSNNGPALIGIGWTPSMFTPSPTGEVVPRGADIGGHALELTKIDVRRKRVWFPQTWGRSWGVRGWGWMSFDALDERLADDGEAVTLS